MTPLYVLSPAYSTLAKTMYYFYPDISITQSSPPYTLNHQYILPHASDTAWSFPLQIHSETTFYVNPPLSVFLSS